MINITIWQEKKKNQVLIHKVIIQGHTVKKNEQEIEPLCSSVSAVTLGAINTLIKLKLINSELIINQKDGYLHFENNSQNQKVFLILFNMIVQLETITTYFTKGIKIKFVNNSKKIS